MQDLPVQCVPIPPFALGGSNGRSRLLRRFTRAAGVFASTGNFSCVLGRFAVGAAILAIVARLATAARVGTFFALEIFHMVLPLRVR
jgi:hypothetical protein